MSRKGVGIGALDRSRITSAHYASHGNQLRQTNAEALATQLSVFRSLVHQFSVAHGKEIRQNPSFRAQFARMCAAIGIDPLLTGASNATTATAVNNTSSSSSSTSAAPSTSSLSIPQTGSWSIWAQLLGRSTDDYYFELAVRVVEVCSATRNENGGFIGVREVCDRISNDYLLAHGGGDSPAGSSPSFHVTEDDVLRAVETLKPLGSAYSILQVGSKPHIRSIPRELNKDQSQVLEAVQIEGFVSVDMLTLNLMWAPARARAAIEDLVSEGMLWVDVQAQPWEYWSPNVMLSM